MVLVVLKRIWSSSQVSLPFLSVLFCVFSTLMAFMLLYVVQFFIVVHFSVAAASQPGCQAGSAEPRKGFSCWVWQLLCGTVGQGWSKKAVGRWNRLCGMGDSESFGNQVSEKMFCVYKQIHRNSAAWPNLREIFTDSVKCRQFFVILQSPV